MKTFFYSVGFLFIFLIVAVAGYLSTIGIETKRFNNIIIKEIEKKDANFEVILKKIKIKLDIKKIQLFLSTINPDIVYQDVKIPITEIKIYSKISKIIASKVEINQIIFSIKDLKIQDMQKIIVRIKPSNFKAYLLNNLDGGSIEKASFNLNIDKNFKLTEYKARGAIKKINVKIKNDFNVKDISFNFIASKNLTLINSINASYDGFLISGGSINLQKKKNIEIKGKLNSQFSLKESQLSKLFKKIKFLKENKIETKGSLIHEFNLKIDNSFKIIDYDYKSSGNISQSQLILKKSLKTKFTPSSLKKIIFEKTKLEVNFNKKKKHILLDGFYSTDQSNYKKFQIKKNLNQTYSINLDLSENFFIDLINFQTDSKKKSNIKSEFQFKNNNLIFKSINFAEGKNFIFIEGLVLNNKNEIINLSSINLKTFNKGKENNNFKINFKNKIFITGDKYDSTNLLKLFLSENKLNLLKNFSKEIEIKIKNLRTKSGMPLSDFNLLGAIKKGKFNKISAKSNFSKDKFLDISLKTDVNNKKILEVYSDLPQALLSNYKFFEGIKGGKLLYNSIIDEMGSASKLTIENFEVIKAPAFATLLTLADLSGFANLLSGRGMSFDILEINLTDDSNLTTIDEILALGTSVSLQMDGYIEKKTGMVNLKGTLVPAKTLNRLVSKIPVLGNILVSKKAGEGIFGVSFKMKGPSGKIKTTVNPVKTLTPRFITRALEKRKKK